MPVLEQGQRLGSYVVEKQVGRGGMAEVYRATHVALDRTVAIKVLNPAFQSDPTFPLRFLREAKAVASLNHPNIVTIYDFGEQGGLAYLVMELAGGGTLHERGAKFSTLQEAVNGLLPVCDALQYAHQRGIIHRDVKPINVLIGEGERPLLADFGLARIVAESLDITTPGLIFGSPHYIAPEQALGEDVDQRADIYALGVVVYQLIAEQFPFTGATPLAIIQQHLSAEPPSIRRILPQAPETLDLALRKAMAKRPQDRFEQVEAFAAELRRAAEEAPSLPVGAGRTLATTESGEALPSMSIEENGPGGSANLDASRPAAAHSGAEGAGSPADPGATVILPGRRELLSAGQGGAAALRIDGAGLLQPQQRRPRASSFNHVQWLALGTAALVVVFINVVGLWLALAGRSAANGNFATSVTEYIFDHLGAFKSALTALALVLAALAFFSMRAAVVRNARVSPKTYRRLRQYHRLVGYAAIIIAVAIGVLTCLGIFGFGTKTPRDAIHSVLGAALFAVIVVKIAVVRYMPAQRRHLKLLGEALLVLFFLAFATSTVPFVWSHLNGSYKSNPYQQHVGEIQISRPLSH